MSHLRGIPSALRERFGVPVVFYDGDVPMSLPEFGGMDTGFNYYHGADPAEYDFVVSNSEGGADRLVELGARRVETLFWGADPDFFTPQPVEKKADVFFYGYGDKFRREWVGAMIGEPTRRLPELDVVLGGADFRGDVGRARLIGDVPFNVFPRAISAARINLNITRRPHATVFASSSCRPFELAACGAAIVSNPYDGIDRWFAPGRELVGEVAAAHGATVLRLPFNLGIGGAVQTGFRYAYEQGFELAVRVDGDGQHDPGELPAILAPVLAGEADICVGSRFAGEQSFRSTRS